MNFNHFARYSLGIKNLASALGHNKSDLYPAEVPIFFSFFYSDSNSEIVQSMNLIPILFRDCPSPWPEHDSESSSETAQAWNPILIPVLRLHRLGT